MRRSCSSRGEDSATRNTCSYERSRKIQAKTYEDVAFQYLAVDEHPDQTTLAEFRQRHLEALAGLFTQALQLCGKAGLVKLGHVAIDGREIAGNASKHKAMSYERMGETEKSLQSEVEEILKRADAVDAAEMKYGKAERRGVAGGVARESRLAQYLRGGKRS